MNNFKMRKIPELCSKPYKHKIIVSSLALTMLCISPATLSQSSESSAVEEEIIVTGIRQSLANALAEKRSADSLIEVIKAEDIGKLPDQNLAEVLENITGIQITRVAGVGTGVQIRGTNANRTEINGVATVGSGVVPLGSSQSDRSGIGFEDIDASIISAVEVTKSPEAKTVEGSVGGTINLKTIRPLELKETLGSIRVQGEDSNLSTEGIQPRFSGAFGDNWDTSIGRIGWVISGSYTEKEAVSFRPRIDLDGGLVPSVNRNVFAFVDDDDDDDTPDVRQLIPVDDRPAAQNFDFLGVQFLTQEQENDDFETINLATTFEWAPNDNLKFYFDAFINEQERTRDQYRVQTSGVSGLIASTVPDTFETVNLGTVGDFDLGEIQVASSGRIGNLDNDSDDPNLRVSTETSARLTDTDVFTLGTEFTHERLSGKVEVTLASSDSRTPQLDATLTFDNPNAEARAASGGESFENAVPIIFDLRSGVEFGIDSNSSFAPTAAQLLDPSNYNLRDITARDNRTETSDDQFKADFSYDLEEYIVKSVDFGYRYNKAESTFNRIESIIGIRSLADTVSADNFSQFLQEGRDDFPGSLSITDFIQFDPDILFSNRDEVINTLNGLTTNPEDLINPQENLAAFYDIEETTNAVYAQANFEYGVFRGNFGVRYVNTNIDSTGFPDGELTTASGGYDFLLPRLNISAEVTDDVVIRFGYGEDIRRPDFRNLNTGFTFNTNENTAVRLGNPDTQPEEVESFDLSVDWYFAPSAVASIGYFRKERTNIFGSLLDSVNPALAAVNLRETDPSCPGGGIFNPIASPNQFNVGLGDGFCVDTTTPFNDDDTTTQTGFELAFQYDLSGFEDRLGWASGFGIIANATFQRFSGGSAEDTAATRGIDIFNAQLLQNFDSTNFTEFSAERGLLDFSETAYNFTLFYEKYGLSARARYTWREAFRTLDFGGGASLNSTLGFPVVTEDRGQLNLSVNYDVTDSFNVGVEVVNLTEEEITQSCLDEGGLTCFEGIPDRRITFGASYRF